MSEAEQAEEDLPQLHLGQVHATNVSKGFSHIRCPDADYDCDVFVHRSVVDPAIWTIGQQVACSVEIGPRGKPQACAPVWRLQGQFKEGKVPELGEFVGEVGAITDAGNSTVNCEDVLEAHGKHAFLHRKVIEQCGLSTGDVIGFTVHVSAGGSPQVSAPCWRDCSQGQGHSGAPHHQSSGSSATAYEADAANRGLRAAPPWAKPKPLDAEVEAELDKWEEARQRKDFATADAVRDQLRLERGVDAEKERGRNRRESEALQSGTAPRDRYKAVLCKHFQSEGGCHKGGSCTFAHGEQELQHCNASSAPSEEDLRQFVNVNGIDDSAADFFYKASPEVQADILSTANFENATNPSAVLVKLIRAVNAERPASSINKDLQSFIASIGVDQPAADALFNSSREVQIDVLKNAHFEGAYNPSAVLMKFIKTSSQEQHEGGRSWHGHSTEPTQKWRSSDQPPAKVARVSATSKMSGGFYRGTVTRVDPAKGYSLVDCPDSGYERHVYVKSLVAPPTKAINIGDIVVFRIQDVDGNPQATAPLFRLIGAEADESLPDIGLHVGRLARVSEDGCGFVESETVKQVYERDVWVATAVMEKCGIELGDAVAFEVTEGKKNGFPQLQGPCWKCCSVEGLEGIRGTNLAMVWASEEGDSKENNVAQQPGQGGFGGAGKDRTNYIIGRVKQVDLVRESCKIYSPDAGFDDYDVHCHKNTADPALLEIDDYVAFPLHISAKGMPQASSPLWKLAGLLHEEADVFFGEWIGKIKETTQAGATFIDCPDLQTEHGREAFIHQNVIDQCGLKTGELIAFSLHFNSRGHPQVQAPCWKFCSQENFAPWPGPVNRYPKVADAPDKGKGKRKHGSGPASSATTGGHVPQLVAPPPKASPGKGKAKGNGKVQSKGQFEEPERPKLEGSYAVGWVTKIDEARDFYVVDVPKAGLNSHHISGRGAVVNFSVASGLAVDDAVFFQMHTNHRGETKASKQFPVWKLIGHSPGGSVPEIGHFVGKVKERNSKGTHYVNCPEAKDHYTNDPFVPDQVVEELGIVAGDTICFDVHLSPKGYPKVTSPCWKNMSPYEPKSLPSDLHLGVKHEERSGKRRLDAPEPDRDAKQAKTEGVHAVGWVKTIDFDRGFSMVEVPNSGYDRDVWVSKATADPHLLAVEDTIFFQIHVNSRGMPQAAAPVWKLVGAVPREGNVSTIGSYKGKIREINENGTAHVDCPEVVTEHGNDAYLDSEVLQETGVRPGDIIFFDIIGNGVEGFPQVSSPMWKSCSDEKWTPLGGSARLVSHEAPRTPPNEEAPYNDQSQLPTETGNQYSAGQYEEYDGLQDCKPERSEDFHQNVARGLSYDQPGQNLGNDYPSQGYPQSQDSHLPVKLPPASPPRDPRQARASQHLPAPSLSQSDAAPASAPFSTAAPANWEQPPPAYSAINSSMADDTPLREGEKAEIYGLNTEAGRQLNNLRVTVVKVDKNTGRVQVRFAPEAQRPQDVRLKAVNLRRPLAP